MTASSASPERIRVIADRVVLTSATDLALAKAKLPEFKTESDYALRNIGEAFFSAPYGRVCNLVNDRAHLQVRVEYRPRFRQLPWMRVAVVPPDDTGQLRAELEAVTEAFAPFRLVIAELAIDFKDPPMTAQFARRHVKVGKLRERRNTKFPFAVWFGVPGGAWFVRGYPKLPVANFRLEAQLNRRGLDGLGLASLEDFARLATVVGRIQFFRMDWTRLTQYLRRNRRDGYWQHMLKMARQHEGHLTHLLRFLRSVGVANPDRFLVALELNEQVAAALEIWKSGWDAAGPEPKAVGSTQEVPSVQAAGGNH